MLLLFFHLASLCFASGPQSELMTLGDHLLEKKISPQQYQESLGKISDSKTLSADDLLYLKDLREKMPLQIRNQVCPHNDGLGCGDTLPERPESPLVATTVDPWPINHAQPPLPKEAFIEKDPSWGIPWWGYAILGAVVVSYEMRGKELQFQQR